MLSPLYPIVDVDRLSAANLERKLLSAVCDYAIALASSGVNILQYRAKQVAPREILSHARELRRLVPHSVKLIMNDRADLCVAADFDGVHVGQQDLSPAAVREIIGPERLLGVSTHNLAQFSAALESSASYLALGPIFATVSKKDPDPVVGLEGIRSARAELKRRGDPRPLVAIGGITRANARQVVDAGADSVAVISDLISSPRQSAEEFLRILL